MDFVNTLGTHFFGYELIPSSLAFSRYIRKLDKRSIPSRLCGRERCLLFLFNLNAQRVFVLNVRPPVFYSASLARSTGRTVLKRGMVAFLLLLAFLHTLCGGGEEAPASPLQPAVTTPAAPGKTPPAPLIELDGSISISPDGSELSYEWKQISGPPVELSDPRSAKPNFRTSKPGTYEFQLVVSSNGLSSEPHIVRLEIEHENLPPVAKVPAEASGQVGTLLEIDGRESFDPEGQSLVYRWRPVTPGLNIPLSALAMPILAFEPQADGVFEVELIVSDGEKSSTPALCRITVKAKPKPPVAQARIITVGIQQPEATEAKPAQKKPARPVAQVRAIPEPGRTQSAQAPASSAPMPPSPPPPALVSGEHAAVNVNNDGPSQATAAIPAPPVSVEPQTPVPNATAMPAQESSVADAGSLLPPLPNTDWMPSRLPPPREASGNSAPVAPISVPPLAGASSPLPVEMDLASRMYPATPVPNIGEEMIHSSSSSSPLLEPSPMMPPAQPEKPRYDVMAAPQTRLQFDRPRPTAHIKGPKLAEVGKPILLDGRESGNGLADSLLDYEWRQMKGPDIQDIQTLYGGAAKQFNVPGPGLYEFQLTVTDGGVQSAPVRHTIRLTDQPEPPVAVVVAPTRANLGALITMDARQSYDLGGSNLVYRWRQTGGPSVRNYVIDDRFGDSAPAFYPPAPGRYSFELIVSNGKMNSRSVDIDIDVEAKLRTPPQLSIAGPSKTVVGEKVELRANADNAGDLELLYQWSQKDGPGQILTPLGDNRAAIHPAKPGKYLFEVTALERGVVAATAELNVEVMEKSGLKKGEGRGGSAAARSTEKASGAGKPEEVVRGASRVPMLEPLPNTPVIPPITSFPAPTLPGNGKGRPAARVLRTNKPPLADL